MEQNIVYFTDTIRGPRRATELHPECIAPAAQALSQLTLAHEALSHLYDLQQGRLHVFIHVTLGRRKRACVIFTELQS